jgi:thimet oligopeptidase
VTSFLAGVEKAFTAPQLAELAELANEKAKHTGDANAKVNRWDTAFYQERLKRERYSVDQEALRKYFPTEASVQFMLKVSADLYGISFAEQKRPGWHSDVRYLEVRDIATKEYLGAIYLDLFPRDGKYNHAAVWPVRNVSVLAKRSPIAALVTNFNRQGLNHDELETLLHEFGHALHTVLSKSQYNVHAGTNVKRDFVEAPSQMFEEWVRRESTLSLMRQVCPTCPQLDSKQITQLDEARKFGRAIRYARQHQYASLDMALVGPQAKDPQKVWEGIEGASPLGYVEGTRFPASFGHIAGGYAAGYYGYMWSEVLALDMLSAFKGSLMDKTVGMKYRRTILEPGAQRDANEMVTEFLGRAPNSDAFFAEINGRR